MTSAIWRRQSTQNLWAQWVKPISARGTSSSPQTGHSRRSSESVPSVLVAEISAFSVTLDFYSDSALNRSLTVASKNLCYFTLSLKLLVRLEHLFFKSSRVFHSCARSRAVMGLLFLRPRVPSSLILRSNKVKVFLILASSLISDTVSRRWRKKGRFVNRTFSNQTTDGEDAGF